MPSIRERVLQYANDPETLAKDLDAVVTINQADTLADAYEVSRLFVYWGQLLACAEELLANHEALHARAVTDAKEAIRHRLATSGDKATDGRASDLAVIDEEVKRQDRAVRIVRRCVSAMQSGVKGLDKKQFMLTCIMQRDRAELGKIPQDLDALKQRYIDMREKAS